MLSMSLLTFTTAAGLAGLALVMFVFERERQRARRIVHAAIAAPQTVETAWVSPPDADGLRCLFVKPAGSERTHTVAIDWEVDEVVRRFSQAGIHIGYERNELAA
jgi:hypothetical protein